MTLASGMQVYMSLRLEAQMLGQPPPDLAAAFTYELCAGIIDKDRSIEEIASEEVGCTRTIKSNKRHCCPLCIVLRPGFANRLWKSADIVWSHQRL